MQTATSSEIAFAEGAASASGVLPRPVLSGTVRSCKQPVGSERWRCWQRQHSSCITGASPAQLLALLHGIGLSGRSPWLSQNWRPSASFGEESGLQACYREAPLSGASPFSEAP